MVTFEIKTGMRVTFKLAQSYNNDKHQKTMKNIFFKVLILIGAPVMIFMKTGYAQNSQSLSEFNRIRLEDNIEAELVIADRHSLFTEQPNEIIVKVENKELVVKRKNPDNHKVRVKVKIFTRALTGIKLDGATTLTTQSTIVADQLSIDIDGAAKALLVVKVKNISVDMDGASSLEIKGSATSAVIETDGAAKLRATGMPAASVTVDTDGASSVYVNATQTLNAKADGASRIRYNGDPQNKKISVEGASTVKKLESNEK
jgi:hypothetical protein